MNCMKDSKHARRAPGEPRIMVRSVIMSKCFFMRRKYACKSSEFAVISKLLRLSSRYIASWSRAVKKVKNPACGSVVKQLMHGSFCCCYRMKHFTFFRPMMPGSRFHIFQSVLWCSSLYDNQFLPKLLSSDERCLADAELFSSFPATFSGAFR